MSYPLSTNYITSPYIETLSIDSIKDLTNLINDLKKRVCSSLTADEVELCVSDFNVLKTKAQREGTNQQNLNSLKIIRTKLVKKQEIVKIHKLLSSKDPFNNTSYCDTSDIWSSMSDKQIRFITEATRDDTPAPAIPRKVHLKRKIKPKRASSKNSLPPTTFDSKPKPSSSNIPSPRSDDLISKLYAMNLPSFASDSQSPNSNSSSTSTQSKNNAFSPSSYDNFFGHKSAQPNLNSSIKFDSLSSYLNPSSFLNPMPPADSITTSDYFSRYLNQPSSSSNSKSTDTTKPGYFSPY
jgi:hypothetical protein